MLHRYHLWTHSLPTYIYEYMVYVWLSYILYYSNENQFVICHKIHIIISLYYLTLFVEKINTLQSMVHRCTLRYTTLAWSNSIFETTVSRCYFLSLVSSHPQETVAAGYYETGKLYETNNKIRVMSKQRTVNLDNKRCISLPLYSFHYNIIILKRT